MTSGQIPFSGPNVWHYPKALMAFFVLFGLAWTSACLALGLAGQLTVAQTIIFGAPALPVAWCSFVRPRLALTEDEVIVVGLVATRYRLRDVVDAKPGHGGTAFRLADGDTFSTSVLQRPNYAAWFGRVSRADRVVTEILTAAAGKRGEPAPDPVGDRHGVADAKSGILMGIAVALSSRFGGGD
ncbi:hypothetical protein [Nocardioides terrae]|uniref:hypothetical protein n=1 Tax=Nocardioides terrae TaxID=574651 RepID=UPI001113A5EF|nr:hypothetical protein [Nocardioides terrae]